MIKNILVALFVFVSTACNLQAGSSAEAQATGPGGLQRALTDNVTLQGSGTVANPVKLKSVTVDGTTLEGTGSAGDPLSAVWLSDGEQIFCDGEYGDYTVAVDETNGRDVCYDNLTIDNATLTMTGHRVFVRGALTFLNGGRISANGGDASGTTAGGISIGSYLGGSGAGGNGGTTGSGTAAATSSLVARDCSNTGGVGSNTPGVNGTIGGACHGGGGGDGTGGSGANGGPVTFTSANNFDFHYYRSAIQALANRSATTPGNGSSGGGGGSGSAGGNGGGGGGGGGQLVVLANHFVPTSCHADGCLQARGGHGASAAPGGNAGGGGGGGGGNLICVVGRGSCPSRTVAGGNGGLKSGTGTDGGNGGPGISIVFQIGY